MACRTSVLSSESSQLFTWSNTSIASSCVHREGTMEKACHARARGQTHAKVRRQNRRVVQTTFQPQQTHTRRGKKRGSNATVPPHLTQVLVLCPGHFVGSGAAEIPQGHDVLLVLHQQSLTVQHRYRTTHTRMKKDHKDENRRHTAQAHAGAEAHHKATQPQGGKF
jgi:hypothetical protein